MSLEDNLVLRARESLLAGAPERTSVAAAIENLPARLDKNHRVDLRLSIPLLGGRYYVTVIADRERRGDERRVRDRAVHPLWTLGNALFMMLSTGAASAVVMLGVLVFSAIIRF